jgi:hypothetical protein
MKKGYVIKKAWVIFFIFLLPFTVSAGDLPAIVSTDCMEKNLANLKLVIRDFIILL